MAAVGKKQLLAQARELFSVLGHAVDDLESQEATDAAPKGRALDEEVKRWQREATKVSATLNKAAPYIHRNQQELLRSTSLMLSEIISAETPQIATERYHDRREDIESGLLRLAQ